ncbi:MAG: L-lactate dehydrogenase [Caulobacterales bacterium]
MRPACIADYREAARRRLPHVLFDYIDGGSYAEETLAANVDDLQDLKLRQRVLRNVASLSTETELFGQQLSMPVVLSPVGLAGMYARRGEAQAAKAAKAAGVPFTLSTMGICSVAEVAAAAVPPWFQLYMVKDRGFMAEVLAMAGEAQCPVLVFTIDLPVAGARYRDARNGMLASTLPARLTQIADGLAHPAWLWDVQVNGRPHTLGTVAGYSSQNEQMRLMEFFGWIARNFDPSISWQDLAWIRERWKGPIVLKGVLDVADAREAVASGVEGIVVSNHGGRQLDGVSSTIRALAPIAQAVGDKTTVLMDGGVRSGLDVLKALASGAKGCLIGRAWAWSLGAGGEAGVTHMLQILRQELRVAMTLTGCTDIRQAGGDLLAN